ncbi:hypothetical protein Cni_G17157 [Canna indica]|uniref:C2H2-type domain-containing protein n=1 Tax=Canna indica TaxID=4628 RepID=A0AAQ3KH87_9LILI|nr:hypothetical protein Cni_G17157 [Canna indica]
MDQARFWMWARARYNINRLGARNYESWEEKAFAEDTAGHLGGCFWPPRSYSCSFCRREFRSAQALGGHMNVHRRDRARLKQSSSSSSSSPGEETVDGSVQHPINSCAVVGNLNPNPNSSALASVTSPRVSAPLIQENWNGNIFFSPSFSSSTDRDKLKGSFFSTSRTLEESTPPRVLVVPEVKLGGGDLGFEELSFQRSRDRGDEEINCNKRRRIFKATPAAASMVRVGSSGDQQQADQCEVKLNSFEELDLELRLGDAPKIK